MNISSTSMPGGDLDARVVLPRWQRVGPGLDLEGPGTLAGRGSPTRRSDRVVGVASGSATSGPAGGVRRRGRSAPPRRRACRGPLGRPLPRPETARRTVAFAGCRPRSTCGMTSMTGIRPTMRPPTVSNPDARVQARGVAGPKRWSSQPRPELGRPARTLRGSARRTHRVDRRLERSSPGRLPSHVVRAIRRFTVHPVLPDALAALGDLAVNLRWSWHPETQDLFRAVDPDLWDATFQDPVRLLGAVLQQRLTSWPATDEFLARARGGRRRPRRLPDRRPLVPGRRASESDRGPPSIAYFSPEFGITSVLPQYSGGLGILAGDHLKSASDLGVPIVGVGLLYRHGYFRQSLSREGWQQETYPVLDPDGLPALAAARRGRHGGTGLDRRSRRRRAGGADLGRPGRPGAAAAARLRHRGERRPAPRRHRPPVRRHQRAPAAPGAAARHRRRPRAAVYSRITGAPRRRCSTPTRAMPGSSASSGSASSPSTEAGPHLDFDTALEVSRAGTVFTTHTPVPAGIDRFPRDLVDAVLRRQQPRARGPRRRDPRARRRGLRGRRRRRVQHGRDGVPAGPARQRRLAAARPGLPRDVQRAVAGLRRGRRADRLDHQRRARPDLGGA